MTQTQSPPRQRIPAWLAVLVILLVMAGGAWFVYQQIFASRDGASGDSIVLEPGVRHSPVEARPSMAARWGFGAPAEGILKRGSGPITARRGNAFLRATSNKSSYTVIFDYLASVRQTWVAPAQWELHLLAVRIVDSQSLADQLKVTADQREKLRALSYAAPLTAAERTSLEELVVAWEKATGPAKDPAGAKLLEAIGKLGAAHLEATKAALVRRVQQIPTILTAQQIAQARGGASAAPATPAKPAATQPTR
ncbi:MAG TPA: hypothetical protein VHP11_02390 [Tepidisphaeraceae bacterium]|nr:hypothetical protein [Tepidisphaeraceae bacterium]